jgi:Na+-translocating ferredoxin:NAD+ oxidoreductase RnfD subunit
MNKIIKNILISLAIIAVLASIIGNVYYFGYKKLETYLMQKGFNEAVSQIIYRVQQTGEVQITSDLILIKK